MVKTFRINGRDYTECFVSRNWTLEYRPIIGNNAGRMLDGSYTEDEIALKAVITITLMPLSETQATTLLDELFSVVYPIVEYYDLRAGGYRTAEMLRDISGFSYREGLVGGDYWGGTKITLTER